MTDKNELPDGGLSKSTAKRVAALASASVSERARELLAAEYSKCGMQQCAADIRSGVFAAAQQLAVNAIKAALEQKVPSGEVAIVCDWRDADPFPTFIEAEIGGKSVSLEWRDRPDGLKELIVPVTDSALRAIEQALTQQHDLSSPRQEGEGHWPLNTKPENGWTFDPTFLERVMKLAEQQDSGEFAPSLEGVETVLLALQAIDALPPVSTAASTQGISYWAVQYPGSMPKLYGARHFAELNWYPDEGAELVRLQEVECLTSPTTSGEKGVG